MLDFLLISTRSTKRGRVEVYPKFIIKKSSDLMIRGRDFYAVWVEDRRLWSTDEQDAFMLIDRELDAYAEKARQTIEDDVRVLHMWDAESGMVDNWHKYCQKQMRDSYHMLDEKLIFSNMETEKKDYASRKLPYPLESGECPAWDRLMSVLYSDSERKKIEWAIGSIVSGESKKIQKFLVLYGSAGTGKSTVLNVIHKLFDGYCSVFDAKALGSSSNAFAFEAFRTNPLVAIQHDGDLSHIEDNTKLNSLVSHESVTVNEKFKSTYENKFKSFLFMGTNKPVRITDAKSGLMRRLIDVSPTGDKLSPTEYKRTVKQIDFELGAIASRCRGIYISEPDAYDDYIPIAMLGASNDFYNFVVDSYLIFKRENGVGLKAAWEMYKSYCDEAKVQYPFSQRVFKEELKNYFREYRDRFSQEDGSRIRSWYSGFLSEKVEGVSDIPTEKPEEKIPDWLIFSEQKSVLDEALAECPAQYARVTEDGKEIPSFKWENVKTLLRDLDTSRTHYVRPPIAHIVIDFDLRDENGDKCLKKNIEAASRWPPTYAELSKSGRGIHLHYIYEGDPSDLSAVFDDYIEIKVFSGNSSLRRKLTLCNCLAIAAISSGLPLKSKGDKKLINFDAVKSEKGLRSLIKRNLAKEIHPNTKPSVEFILKILDEAYQSGMKYDVSDMMGAVTAFAANSTNNAAYCLSLVPKMKFKSDEPSDPIDFIASVIDFANSCDDEIIFFDVEVFMNLLVVCWKKLGKEPVNSILNPSPEEIEELLRHRLVGFNCRRYDNHILYARLIGYDNAQLYSLSQKIVKGERNAFFGEAYNISYTDIYDFSSVKQSLKKFEIDLGIHHQELGLPWDEPVPEDMWPKVAEYCKNDVTATEAVWNARQADFTARQILADITGMTVNDTTNSLSARFIFGKERKPQSAFNYRNLGDTSDIADNDIPFYTEYEDEFTKFNSKGQPVFPGYIYENGKSTYRGEEVGEGGYVYAEPGMYKNVALLDIASMHPSSVIAEDLFGKYTERFKALKDARLAIKHKDFESAKSMMDGALSKYLTDESQAKNLAQALKIVINAVYGLTSAKFDNPFRDPRNEDNIVAKRGALFMINLKHMVQSKGFTVAHIKTDSIKIPDATPEIISFVTEYGKKYGYDFEHEATYDRMCLVNDAVYVAKYDSDHGGEWTATGTQFQVPYVFKTLFSKEKIIFEDLCETKSVTTSLYLDFNEGMPEGEHNRHFVGKVGLFCPMKEGAGGGELLREGKAKDGSKKYDSATGCKGWRWMESEMVKTLGKEDYINKDYYKKLVDDAIKTISQYGDIESFTAD